MCLDIPECETTKAGEDRSIGGEFEMSNQMINIHFTNQSLTKVIEAG